MTGIGYLWIGLGVVVFTGAAIFVAFKFIAGLPGGEGIVMMPEALVALVIYCVPGIAVLLLGKFLKRKADLA
jgi:hypothetical protein